MEKVIEIDCLPDIVNETGKETNIPYLRSGECTKCAGYCFFIHNIYDTSKLGFCLSFFVLKKDHLIIMRQPQNLSNMSTINQYVLKKYKFTFLISKIDQLSLNLLK